jgi:hypothetical protein
MQRAIVNLDEIVLYGPSMSELSAHQLNTFTHIEFPSVSFDWFFAQSRGVYALPTKVVLELMRSGYEHSDEFESGLDVLLQGLASALPSKGDSPD